MKTQRRRFPGSLALISCLAALAACSSAPASTGADAVSSASNLTAPDVDPQAADLPRAAGGGKVLVAYFAQGKAAAMAAADLARIFSADPEPIREEKARVFDFFGYMAAGYEATFAIPSAIAAPDRDPSAYDLVVVVTPVWAWNLSPAVRAWLRLTKGRIPKAAFVTVSGGTEPDAIAREMAKESGVNPVAVLGFEEADFEPGNRAAYIGKLEAFAAAAGGK